MRPSLPEAPAPDASTGDHVTVEAATAEQAIAQVHERLGVDARIVHAEKVLRGGLWGFFQKQVVQLAARPAEPVSPQPEPQGLEAVLARLSTRANDEEEGLGTALRRHLGVQIDEERAAVPSAVVTASAEPAPSPWPVLSAAAGAPRLAPVRGSEPAETPTGIDAALSTLEAPPTTGPVATPPSREESPPAPSPSGLPIEDVEYARGGGTPWSGRGLLMLGLPRGLVDGVLVQEPADDAAWTYALARTLAPLCRPLPSGPATLAGPRAEKLSRELGIPLVRMTAAPRGRSTFAVACTDSGRARSWIAGHRGKRWLHLVVGGSDWRGLLFEGPLAVSWVGDDALGDAIRTAHDLGMVLGPGVSSGTAGTLVEPSPIELAMLLRDMLGGGR